MNMVSGSFLPLFPRRSKLACPSDEYCFTCICSLVAETGSSCQLNSFCLKGSCLRKQKGGWLLIKQIHTFTSSMFFWLLPKKNILLVNVWICLMIMISQQEPSLKQDGYCCLQKQLYLVVFLDEGRVFCFCFILHRFFVCVSFCLWSLLLSPASMIRKLRTLLPRGTRT